MSNAQRLIVVFRAAHDFLINNSTFNNVGGNYVRDTSWPVWITADIIVMGRYMPRTTTKLPGTGIDLCLYIAC